MKGQTGEYVGAAALHSYFDVKSIVSVPHRSPDVPILDQVFEIRRGQNNTKWDFVFDEAKGGEEAVLSHTLAWKYSFDKGRLVRHRSGGRILQGTGEWYYYRLAEIFRKAGKEN